MARRWLEARAPFGAFYDRYVAGLRATAPAMTPTAAYNLLLNLAVIDRREAPTVASSPDRPDLPRIGIALGLLSLPGRGALVHQIHSWPVGASGKEQGKTDAEWQASKIPGQVYSLEEAARGSKFWIEPARCEVLTGLHMLIGFQCDDALADRIDAGIRGDLPDPTYGMPCAGCSDYVFDRLRIHAAPPPARWYVPVCGSVRPGPGCGRFPLVIDRRDDSKSRYGMFTPTLLLDSPPDDAWIPMPAAVPTPARMPRRGAGRGRGKP